MNKIIFAIVATFFSCLGYSEQIITDKEINNALHRLYTEIDCPATYHVKDIPYPYVYCIDNITYKNEKIYFKFNVFENYASILKEEVKGNKKNEFKELLKLVAWDLGISFSPTQNNNVYGVIDRLHLSNVENKNIKTEAQIKEWIKNTSMIYLVNYENKKWYQAGLGLNKRFYYSTSLKPKPIQKLFSEVAKSVSRAETR